MNGGSPHSWPAVVKRSGGAPIDAPSASVLLPVPRVEAAGIDADRHVGDAGRPARTPPPADGRGTTGPRRGRRRDRARPARSSPVPARRIPQIGRPRLPARSVALGQHAESSPALERVALRVSATPRRRPGPRIPASQIRSSAARFSVQTRPRSIGRSSLSARPARASSSSTDAPAISSSAQVKRVGESPRARVVRARLRRRTRVGSAERADRQEPGAPRGRPAAELPQVREIPDAPAAAGAQSSRAARPDPTCAGRRAGGTGRDR